MTSHEKQSAPQLPDTLSSDGREIWDWAAAMARHDALQYKISELRKQIRGIGNRCGDCYKWMHSDSCPRETHVKGRPSGPSCNASICDQYVEKQSSTEWRDKLTADLAALVNNERKP